MTEEEIKKYAKTKHKGLKENHVLSFSQFINEDAYRAWIIKIEMSDKSELDALLSAGAYAEIAK